MCRFATKRSPWWQPLLGLVGMMAARAYLEVDRERLVARSGWYRLEVARAQIAAVAPGGWPWWWRIDGKIWRGRLGLIGATEPVLCLRLASQRRPRLLGIPLHPRGLCVSVDDPAAVRTAVGACAETGDGEVPGVGGDRRRGGARCGLTPQAAADRPSRTGPFARWCRGNSDDPPSGRT